MIDLHVNWLNIKLNATSLTLCINSPRLVHLIIRNAIIITIILIIRFVKRLAADQSWVLFKSFSEEVRLKPRFKDRTMRRIVIHIIGVSLVC